MTEFREITPAGKADNVEEIFTCFRLPNVTHDFLISKEELLDATLIYRIYHLDGVSWRRIEEYQYTRIRALMEDAATTFNSGNSISAQSKLNKLLKLWTRFWEGQTPHGVNTIQGDVVPVFQNSNAQ